MTKKEIRRDLIMHNNNEKWVKDRYRHACKKYSPEDKIRIVLEGMRSSVRDWMMKVWANCIMEGNHNG